MPPAAWTAVSADRAPPNRRRVTQRERHASSLTADILHRRALFGCNPDTPQAMSSPGDDDDGADFRPSKPPSRASTPKSLLVVRSSTTDYAQSVPSPSHVPARTLIVPPRASSPILRQPSPGINHGAAAVAIDVPTPSSRARQVPSPHNMGLAKSMGNVRPVQLLGATTPAQRAVLAYLPPSTGGNSTRADSPFHAAGGGAGGGGAGGYPPPLTPTLLPPSIALSSIRSASVPSARDELRLLWRLGWPVAVAILFRIAMLVTDLAMLGHKNTDWLAAASAATIWINITSAFLYRAFGGSLNTLCSQAFGAGNFKLVGMWLQQGLLFASIGGCLVALSWWFTGSVLRLMLIEDDVADLANEFAHWSLLWLAPTIWSEMLQRYFQAQHVLMPALVINAAFVFVNALLNLLLLYGLPSGWMPRQFNADVHENGWEGLGFKGSPIATAISRWGMFLTYLIYTVPWRRLHAATWQGWTLHRRGALHPVRVRQYLLQQCLPSAIGICLEEWQLQVIAIFATRLGTAQIATHNATLEVFFFVTALMFGLVAAVQIRIGFYLGASNAPAAKQVGRLGLRVSAVIGVVVGGVFVLARAQIGEIYSSDPEILHEAERISVLVGAAYFALSVFYTSMAILNGQARPGIVALSFLVGCWAVCIPVSYVLAFTAGQGLFGLWVGLCVGYAFVTVIVGVAAYRSDWDACVVDALKRAEIKKAAAEDAAKQIASSGAKDGLDADGLTESPSGPRRKRSSRSSRKGSRATTPAVSGRLAGSVADKTVTFLSSADPSNGGSSGSVVVGVDSINQRNTSLLADESPATDERYRSSEDDDEEGAFTDDDEPWNAEELRYRDQQIAEQRRAAMQAPGMPPPQSHPAAQTELSRTPNRTPSVPSSFLTAISDNLQME